MPAQSFKKPDHDSASFPKVEENYDLSRVTKKRKTYRGGDQHYRRCGDVIHDNSRSYGGNHYEGNTINHGTVNNVERAENVNFGANYGSFQQNASGRGHDDREGWPPPGQGAPPLKGPSPSNSSSGPFLSNAASGYSTECSPPLMEGLTAMTPQYQHPQFYPQQTGPSPNAPPYFIQRYGDSSRPEGLFFWQQHEESWWGSPDAAYSYPVSAYQLQLPQGPPAYPSAAHYEPWLGFQPAGYYTSTAYQAQFQGY